MTSETAAFSEEKTRPELAAALAALQAHRETAHLGPRVLGVRCKICVRLCEATFAAQPSRVPHPRRIAKVAGR